jgi:hypothetical protein
MESNRVRVDLGSGSACNTPGNREKHLAYKFLESLKRTHKMPPTPPGSESRALAVSAGWFKAASRGNNRDDISVLSPAVLP